MSANGEIEIVISAGAVGGPRYTSRVRMRVAELLIYPEEVLDRCRATARKAIDKALKGPNVPDAAPKEIVPI